MTKNPLVNKIALVFSHLKINEFDVKKTISPEKQQIVISECV